jgi:hypothetical protein
MVYACPMKDNLTLYQLHEDIQQNWGLSNEQMSRLAHVDVLTYERWLEEGRNSINPPSVPSGMDNAVPIVSIYKALQRKFPEFENQVKWLFEKNPDFDNNKPIDVATSSVGNLFWISYYLDTKKA